MKLALDFDGCISDTMQSWVDKYNQKYYGDLTKDLITHRDIDVWAFYKKMGMTLDECMDIFSMAWSDWKNLEPMERHLAQKTKMLSNLCSVDIVTAVRPENLPDVKNWLAFHKISYGELVHSNEKEKLDYDIYIDDSESNAMKMLTAGKLVLLYNQPWNRNVPNTIFGEVSSINRVYNMYHAIDIVRNIV